LSTFVIKRQNSKILNPMNPDFVAFSFIYMNDVAHTVITFVLFSSCHRDHSTNSLVHCDTQWKM